MNLKLKIYHKLLTIILLWLSFSLNAQVVQKTIKEDNTVHLVLKTRFTGNEVRLRWAPSRAGAWSLLNRTGYIIDRLEVIKGRQNNWIRLSPKAIKPEPVDNWKRFATPPNKNALIAAQAIYGKKFAISGNTSLNDKADELTNRYSFTLLAADLSFETAQAAGLGFIDKTAENGKNYVYRVLSAEKLTSYAPIDTAIAGVETKQIEKIEKPIWQQPIESEHRIDLRWDINFHSSLFTAYFIERSADGRNYVRLNKDPYINMDSEIADKTNFFYADSVKTNYQPFYYRLIGITEFGELSPSSEPIKAMGRDKTPPPAPFNLKTKSLGGSRVEISWEASQTADLQGFFIGRSKNSLENYSPLVNKPLSPTTRKYIDEKANTDTTNFYIVAAVDTAQNAAASLAVYAQIIDSIPPAKPSGLFAKIDNKGILKLAWRKNQENDIKGYIVLAANQRDHVFTTLVKSAISDTIFKDTLQLKTLTEKIYYQVKAVDKNDNTSAPSEILEVSKPDIVPPSPPLFNTYDIKPNGVLLKWTPSSSKDAIYHIIYRKENSEKAFQELGRVERNSTYSLLDNTVQPNKSYEYIIKAEDDAGLQSQNVKSLFLKIPEFTARNNVQGFRAIYDNVKKQVNLSWQNPSVQGSYVVLYRADNGGPFLTLTAPTAGSTQYQDRTAKSGIKYEYTTRLYYPDGKSSPFGTISKLSF